MKLTIMRFRRDHPGNTTYYMAQNGVSFDKQYYEIGYVAQAKKRIVLMLIQHDWSTRMYTVDADRIEIVPEEEINA